jgi:hypothetical protein
MASSSRTAISRSKAGLVLAVALACFACGKKGASLAELVKADGPVDRQANSGKDWSGASLHAKFFLGDAARTSIDGGAELTLLESARLTMKPASILRFGGSSDKASLKVEQGEVELSRDTGNGNYDLGLGQVTLGGGGKIRITADAGGNSIQVLAGSVDVLREGTVTKLGPGDVLGEGSVTVIPKDAGVDAGPTDAGVDGPPAGPEDATATITGKKAELLAPGETKWTALPAGPTTLAKGAKLRLGPATTATLVAKDLTLELGSGSRAGVGDDLTFGLELGGGRASVPQDKVGKVGVPGGEVALTGPADARIDVNPHGEAKVTVNRGAIKLTGANGAGAADMNRGETATLGKTGTVHMVEEIPTYYDFAVTLGIDSSSFRIHDPKGRTALRFVFGAKCSSGGVIEIDHDSHFHAPRVSGGKEGANVMLTSGGYAWRARCTQGDAEGPAVASGSISVIRDDGRRPLPPKPGKNPIDADGRTWSVGYTSLIPIIEFHFPGKGSTFKLHLQTGGAEETYDSSSPVVTVEGTKLKEATYTYYFDHDGVKQDKVSTLKITFDQTAAQVYIESPLNGQPLTPPIDVHGSVLPGWSAKVGAFDVPVDKNTRRFGAKVDPPDGQALAIRLSHPQRGVHFYLRRAAK